ncbi:class I SAM-dependent methyltransferase [Jannaschia sp. M317]|uniref:class I SAM-dependent methyltransferase n=1 Tax=Jannaschia sp. M317 TaxID=2867011 RepID=UPI0021A57B39|nr:hypothetical protein [Jannaschia sp. M317]UWQ19682.1 hypothetical protein K3551_18195 [Jannaschia sp. M317]
MSPDQTEDQSHLPKPQDPDLSTPLSNKALFWPARYLAPDPVLHHVPLLFWLFDVMRPSSFLTLGNPSGVVHFAACQAADRLDCDTQCEAFCPWPDNTVPETLTQYAETHFEDLSRLQAHSLKRAPRRIANRSVDILFIDIAVTPDLGEALRKKWLPKLSDRGVVILHGLETQLAEDAGEDLLDHVRDLGPGFELMAGSGLHLVGVGNQIPDRLRLLLDQPTGGQGRRDAQRVLKRLGRLHHLEAERAEGARLRTALKEAETQLRDRTQAHDTLAEKHKDLIARYDVRNTMLATTQSKLFDVERATRAEAAQIPDLERDLDEARKAWTAANQELEALRDARATLGKDHTALKTAHEELKGTLDALQQTKADLAKKVAALEKAEQDRRKALTEQETDLAALRSAQTETSSHLLEAQGLLATRETEIATLRSEAEADRTTLQDRLKEQAEALARTKEKAEQHLAGLENRKSEVVTLKDQIGKLTEMNEAATQRIAALEADLAKRQEAGDTQAQDRAAELEARNTDLARLTEQLKAETTAREAAEAQAQDRATELEARNTDLAHLTERFEIETTAREAAEAQAQDRATELEARNTDLARLTERFEIETTAREAAEAQVQDRAAELEARNTDLARLTERFETETTARETAEAQVQDRAAELEARNTDLARLTERFETETTARETAEAQVQDRAAELEARNTDLARLTRRLETETTARETAETGLAARFEEIARLIQRLEQTAKTEAATLREVEARDGDIARLSKRLAEAQEEQTRREDAHAKSFAAADVRRIELSQALEEADRKRKTLEKRLESQDRQAADDKASHAAKIAALRDATARQLHELDTRFTATQDTRFMEIAQMTRWLEATRQELERSRSDHETARQSADRLSKLVTEFREMQTTLSGGIRQRQGQLDAQSAQLDAQSAHLDALSSQLAEREDTIAGLTRDNGTLANQIDAMLNSNSWRITEPVRKLVSSARRRGGS